MGGTAHTICDGEEAAVLNKIFEPNVRDKPQARSKTTASQV